MRNTLLILFISLFGSSIYAQNKNADTLIASKKKADMTYKQLMEIMGSSLSMIQQGVIRENKQMVIEGASFILNHPAPRYKPWTIMKKSDQNDFKQSLLSYDETLDVHARRAMEEAKKENWLESSNAAHDLTNSCITCHLVWKSKVIR